MLQYLKEHEEVGLFDPEAEGLLSAALDQAWKSIEASGAIYETDQERQVARDTLASSIVFAAKHGERNVETLAREALIHLAIVQAAKRRK